MPDRFCHCNLKTYFYEPVSLPSIILELMVSFTISVGAILINYKYRKVLQEEKRARPLGRKGNVIEPITTWLCLVLTISIPIKLLLRWIYANEIIPFDYIPYWLCNILQMIDRIISYCLVYHSLFVAIIRYIYIVHQRKANQWDFEKVGKRFKLASIAVPVGMEIMLCFFKTNAFHYKITDKFRECVDSYEVANNITSVQVPRPTLVQLTLNYAPETFVFAIEVFYTIITAIVALNLVEAFLYYRIFAQMKR